VGPVTSDGEKLEQKKSYGIGGAGNIRMFSLPTKVSVFVGRELTEKREAIGSHLSPKDDCRRDAEEVQCLVDNHSKSGYKSRGETLHVAESIQ
jgi:hypothetical protein